MTNVLEQEAPRAPLPGTPRRSRRWSGRMIPVALMLLGAIVLLYPVGATYYNNFRQAEFAAAHQAEVRQADPADLSAALAAARSYNQALPPGVLTDPWAGGEPAQSADYAAYLEQLSDFETMARLRIPEIAVDQPVYHGTSDAVLARGVGHLFGSALPVGGPGTHSVLTAHSGLSSATHFDRLHELQIGDVIYLDIYGETLAYQVDQINVVLPDDFTHLARIEGRDMITLITCTPYGVNSHRLLVRAERIEYDPAVDHTAAPILAMDWSIQPWMWQRIAIAGLALLMLLGMMAGWIRSDRRTKREQMEVTT